MADKIQLPRTSLNLMRKIVLAIFAISIIFGAGYALGFKGYYSEAFSYPKVNINRDLPVDKKDLEFSFFWRIWDTISAKYYDKDGNFIGQSQAIKPQSFLSTISFT